jgi:predicted metalloendopeptidase
VAGTEEPSPATLLDQLASLDPQERRELAAIVRRLSENDADLGGVDVALVWEQLTTFARERWRSD